MLAGLGLVGLVLSLPALYLVDLPAWVYQGALFQAEAADASATPWSQVAYPVPNTFATLLPALLLPLAGPIWTGKLIAIGLLVAGFAAAWALARAPSPDDASSMWARAAVLIACVVVSSSFWNGYLGYQMGVIGAMALGAVWLRRGHLSAPMVLLGSLVLFFAHAIPFAVVALAMGVEALRRRDLRQLAALLPAAALTAWYGLARLAQPGGGFVDAETPGGGLRWLAYKVYTVLKVGPYHHPDGVDGVGALATLPTLYWLCVIASALFMAALILGLALGTYRMASSSRRLATWGAWALAVVALALPPFALNVVNPGERILVLAVVALVVLVPLDPRLLRVLGLAALVFLLDDASSLWAQRDGLSDADRIAFYADRAEREQNPDAYTFEDAVEEADASSTPLLGHPVRLHSDLYDAVLRRDWTRLSFDSGLLRPPTAPRTSP
ncbi:MAG: hypothetical protein Rubg2KO_35910 [Rubricoccaceae bacterium]